MTQDSSRKRARTRKRESRERIASAAFFLLLSSLCLFIPAILLAQNANRSRTPQTATAAQASLTPTPQAATAQSSPTPTPTPTPPSTLHQWGAVTLFHGLPSNRVRAIAQGADGSMWFGTDGGLAKYDGRRTQAVAVEGLMSKRVLALKLDADSTLWIGTETGAMRFIGGEFRAIREADGKAITAIITPERGRAILASDEGVIFDCRTNEDKTLNVKTIPERPLTSADFEKPGPLNLTSLAWKDNTLYVGTRSRGVIVIEEGAVKEIQSRPRPFFVETIEQDARGQLWYGAKAKREDSGLFEASNSLQPAKTGAGLGTVLALRAGAHDDLWVGTDGRGAYHYKDARLVEKFTFEGTAGGLRSDHVSAIFVDREDVVWFGTDRGVCRYDPHAPRVETVSTVAESNFVRTLFQTSSGQLLSGTNRGLFIYDKQAATWNPVSDLSQSPVYAIAEDRTGRVLIGAASGLYRSERPARESAEDTLRLKQVGVPEGEESAGDNMRAVAQFQGATYIGGFGRGVERFNNGERTLLWPTNQESAQDLRNIVSLYADKSGRLWIGTALAGVFVFDGRETRAVPALEKLKGSAVWAIADDGGDHLWFASARGLYLYQGGEMKQVVRDLDVRSVTVASDDSSKASVWCATAGGGLLKVLIDAQFGTVVSRLDAEQGLPSQSAFAVLPVRAGDSGDGTLLIGTNRGVVHYTPSRIAPVLSPVRILGQRAHSLDEVRGGGLKLEYPQDSLALDVAAISSRTFPEQFQYAFELYDRAGKLVKQKFSHDAQFTMESLKPGNYRVQARAFSKDLIASESLSFEFGVAGAPFPWTTTLLSVLLALALLALWWGYLQNRRLARTGATLQDTNRQLADARLQLANETEAERRRIARDLHDQTLADLRHLLMLTDQLPANGNEDGQKTPLAPTVFRSEIESISNEIRRICEDLSPSVLENVGFSAALEWALSNAVTHSPSERPFEYEFVGEENLDERLDFSRATQMQIYRITQEVVSNVMRHASATRVRLSVSISAEGDFVLMLEDDGRWFDPREKKLRQGRGLANIRARASLIEAEVKWRKRAGGGTEFTLRKRGAIKTSDAQRTV